MKHPNFAAVLVLVLVAVWSLPAQAEREETGATAAQGVDWKARLMKASVKRETYGIEGKDWDIAQTTEIRSKKFHARTPRLHALAKTVTTKALHELVIGAEPPVLIDVLGGKAHRTIPGAIWLKGAGVGDDREEDIDDRLDVILDEVTKADRTRAIVFFCRNYSPTLSTARPARAI